MMQGGNLTQGAEFNPVQHAPFSIVYKIRQLVWRIVNLTLFRCSPFFCRKFRVFLLRIFGAKIDWSCSVDRKVEIDYPWHLKMGAKSRLTDYTWLQCLAQIEIGQNVCVGRGVQIVTGSHDVSSTTFQLLTDSVCIKDDVWIATSAFISKGVTVGSGSVVAAHAVVTKGVDPWTVVGGNPAKIIKQRKFAAKQEVLGGGGG